MKVKLVYDLQYPAHSEREVLYELDDYLDDTDDTITYETSTAQLFDIIRGWCYENNVPLEAWYYDTPLPLDKRLRLDNKYYALCKDFNIYEEALDSLMGRKVHSISRVCSEDEDFYDPTLGSYGYDEIFYDKNVEKVLDIDSNEALCLKVMLNCTFIGAGPSINITIYLYAIDPWHNRDYSIKVPELSNIDDKGLYLSEVEYSYLISHIHKWLKDDSNGITQEWKTAVYDYICEQGY